MYPGCPLSTTRRDALLEFRFPMELDSNKNNSSQGPLFSDSFFFLPDFLDLRISYPDTEEAVCHYFANFNGGQNIWNASYLERFPIWNALRSVPHIYKTKGKI